MSKQLQLFSQKVLKLTILSSFLIVIRLFFPSQLNAQALSPSSLFKDVEMTTDSAIFSSSRNTILWNGVNYLRFNYSKENEICDVKVWPSVKIKKLTLMESGDFSLIDSIINFNNQYYTFKVQFKNLHLKTYKPDFREQKPNYDLPPLVCSFNVKSSGLQFLQIDKNDVVLDENSKNEGVEIQLDNNRFLQLNSTYLVEAKEPI